MFKVDGERRDFSIEEPRTILGRDVNVNLRIPLPSVSRRHCEIEIENGQILLRDLGSRNGTFLNNNRVETDVIKPGDRLTIGPVVLTVVLDGQPCEIEPVQSKTEINPLSDIPLGLDNSDTDPAIKVIKGSSHS